ncbi:MAG: IS1380 family transposase, partial [Alphaproteobacteria bacterium]
MTNCSQFSFAFPACRKRRVEADFLGGDVTSNAGALLLRAADRTLGLTQAVARGLGDARDQARVRHSVLDQLRQRVYGMALGYEDLNDHDGLRHDLALQTAVDREGALASAPTLCRFENRAERRTMWAIQRVIVERFIASHDSPPEELILDFDATDDAVHGHQEGRFFHGYYDHYCFLPLYVFSGDHLLVAYLRPSNIDAARHSLAILGLLVKRLRQAWPEVRIIVRADSGFCRWRTLSWCERAGVGYITGLAKNARLDALAAPAMAEAKARFERTGEKQRLFADLSYAAKTWDKERRVIARLEHGEKGANPRYVVTNLAGDGDDLYDRLYCARGDMENRIKEQQL